MPLALPSDYGGAWGQLCKLLRGRHPRTGTVLEPPFRDDGSPWQATGCYARLDVCVVTSQDVFFGGMVSEGFVPYIPEALPSPKPLEGKTAREKMAERLLRVRAKEAANTRLVKVQLRRKNPAESFYRLVL